MRFIRPVLVCVSTVVVVLAGVVLPAQASSDNGEAAKPAKTIVADAIAATKTASSARISGSFVDGTQHISLDVVSGNDGAGGGKMTTNGETFTIVVAPPNLYLKADAKTWDKVANNKAAGEIFAGKWLETTTANTDFGSAAQLFDLGALADKLGQPTGNISKGKTTSYHGESAIPIQDKTGTLYVAATGQPYILGLVGTGNHRGELRISAYNTAKSPAQPANALNLDQLENQAG
jgi:hypothetical protein